MIDSRKEIDIVELPLNVMDMSLFQHDMRLDLDGAWRIVKEMINLVHQCGGVFVVNWHNSWLEQGSDERWIY
ncbi:hypothetical protein [Methanospirillum sp.]